MARSIAGVLVAACLIAGVPKPTRAQDFGPSNKDLALLGGLVAGVAALLWFIGRAHDDRSQARAARLHDIVQFDSPTISFQLVEAGKTESLTAVLTNVSTRPLGVRSVSVSGRRFTLESAPAMPVSVPPGGRLEFKVRFEPTGPCRCKGELRVSTDLRDVDPKAALLGLAK